MARNKLRGAVRVAAPGAGAALAVRVARSLYGRWRRLGAADRRRMEWLAQETKRQALELRGKADSGQAERELRSTSEELAQALVDSAVADPEVDELEVRRLREELRRELDRLATSETPPGA